MYFCGGAPSFPDPRKSLLELLCTDSRADAPLVTSARFEFTSTAGLMCSLCDRRSWRNVAAVDVSFWCRCNLLCSHQYARTTIVTASTQMERSLRVHPEMYCPLPLNSIVIARRARMEIFCGTRLIVSSNPPHTFDELKMCCGRDSLPNRLANAR